MYYLFKNEVVDYNFFNSCKKQTILFIHGWGGNKNSFNQTINLLKNQFNILSITMPTIQTTVSIWSLFDYVNLIENILLLHQIESVIIICHSFGFRVAMLLNQKIYIEKIVVTGGAGIRKNLNIFQKIIKNNNKIILKDEKHKYFFKSIASADYLKLTTINKETFKNIVNLNLKFVCKFNSPMLLFWGRKDRDTPIWIAHHLKKLTKSSLVTTNSDHFSYIKESAKFNHETLKFLKKT